MALVGKAFATPCRREGLTRARPCPDFFVVWPPREPERMGPAAKAGEEVRLLEAFEVFRLDVDNAPRVDFARGDVPFALKVFEPLGRVRFVLVVEGFTHVFSFFIAHCTPFGASPITRLCP
jgi:hypothetical protein